MKKLPIRRILRRYLPVLTASCALAFSLIPAHGQDWDRKDYLWADLSSFNQVPSVLATGHGNFKAQLNGDGTISFELSYADMSSPVVQAHIHFGESMTNGGVAVFLCGGAKPACPASGTVTGTITAADVSVLPASNSDSVIPQGIQPGDLAGIGHNSSRARRKPAARRESQGRAAFRTGCRRAGACRSASIRVRSAIGPRRKSDPAAPSIPADSEAA